MACSRRASWRDAAALLPGPHFRGGASGKDDFLLGTTKDTVVMLERYGFPPVYRESVGRPTQFN